MKIAMIGSGATGSVFAASLVHGATSKWDMQFSVDFATMASAFKATISGDLSAATESEIASLLAAGVKPSIRQ